MSLVLLDGLDHGQAHVDAITRVLGATDGQTGDAVVAVPEDLDPHALRDSKLLFYPAELGDDNHCHFEFRFSVRRRIEFGIAP